MEDKTEKHPVTPCEVIPARELLADMLMEMKQWDKALIAYEEDLKKHPNRFNGLYGAALAAEKSRDNQKAEAFYKQLVSFVKNKSRPEFRER
jgi:tetratricopeptide (TPR) repeat protein